MNRLNFTSEKKKKNEEGGVFELKLFIYVLEWLIT